MRPPSLSFRGAKRRGNLGEAVALSPMAFPRSGRVLRDCHVGLWPPRNDKFESIVRSTMPTYHLPACMAVTDRRYRCNRFLRFYRHLVRTGSAFPRLPRRFAPRNDNSEVHTILTMACTDRQHCAERGMPLPYNAQTAALHNSGFSSKCI